MLPEKVAPEGIAAIEAVPAAVEIRVKLKPLVLKLPLLMVSVPVKLSCVNKTKEEGLFWMILLNTVLDVPSMCWETLPLKVTVLKPEANEPLLIQLPEILYIPFPLIVPLLVRSDERVSVPAFEIVPLVFVTIPTFTVVPEVIIPTDPLFESVWEKPVLIFPRRRRENIAFIYFSHDISAKIKWITF